LGGIFKMVGDWLCGAVIQSFQYDFPSVHGMIIGLEKEIPLG
jgi:hypothetical protein